MSTSTDTTSTATRPEPERGHSAVTQQENIIHTDQDHTALGESLKIPESDNQPELSDEEDDGPPGFRPRGKSGGGMAGRPPKK